MSSGRLLRLDVDELAGWRGEDFAGDVAPEAEQDLAGVLAVGGAVVAGAWVVAEPDDRDASQGCVRVPVAAAVEVGRFCFSEGSVCVRYE